MNKKMQWGLAALLILQFLIGVGAIVMLYTDTETEQKNGDHPVEEQVSPIADQPPRPAREGYKWEHHGDHWHEVHVSQATPSENEGQDETVILADDGDSINEVPTLPDYIYDPQREKPDGWDPELVFETGDKKIDLNFRPLTDEEQAEYERLKATENPEHYGDKWEAGLRITAICNIFIKNTPAFLESQEAAMLEGASQQELKARLKEFSGIFAD